MVLARRALEYMRLSGQRIWMARGHSILGWALHVTGESTAAGPVLVEGVALARGRAPKMEAVLLSTLGDLARQSGNLTQAEAMYRQSMAIRQRLGLDAMFVRLNAVLNDCAGGNFDAAAEKLVELFASLDRNERPPVRAVAHTLAALIAAHRADWRVATDELERAGVGLASTGIKDPDIRDTLVGVHRVAAAADQERIALRAGELAIEQIGQAAGAGEAAVREEIEAYRAGASSSSR